MLSDITVTFNLACVLKHVTTNNFLYYIPYLEDIDDLYFGFLKNHSFIFPPSGNGLAKYSPNPVKLPGINGEYVLGFKGIFVCSQNITTDIHIALTWKNASLIVGIPVLFEEKSQNIKRIDSIYFRF